MSCDDVDWMRLNQGKVYWPSIANTVMNFSDTQKEGNFLPS